MSIGQRITGSFLFRFTVYVEFALLMTGLTLPTGKVAILADFTHDHKEHLLYIPAFSGLGSRLFASFLALLILLTLTREAYLQATVKSSEQ